MYVYAHKYTYKYTYTYTYVYNVKNISIFTLDINANVSWPNPRAVSGIKITYIQLRHFIDMIPLSSCLDRYFLRRYASLSAQREKKIAPANVRKSRSESSLID